MARILNSIIVILSFLGVFVAGLLSYSHAMSLFPPCGGSGGCEAVQLHPSSMWFGIPVAYFGLAGYMMIALVGIFRSMKSGNEWKGLTQVGLALSLFGALSSGFLTFTSLVVIGTTCLWCLISAGLMISLFLIHAFLFTLESPEDKGRIDIPALAIGAVAAIGLFGVFVSQLQKGKSIEIAYEKAATAIPAADRIVGPKEAAVTIVEFADMNCPTCRRVHKDVKNLLGKFSGKINYGFRNLPLSQIPGHETSLYAALVSEYAGKSGKFYEFLDTAFSEGNTERVKSKEGLTSIGMETGLNMEKFSSAVMAEEGQEGYLLQDELLTKVNDDIATAASLGVNSTPTFVIIAKGVPAQAVQFNQLEGKLNMTPYKELLK